jgi:hypothetical protein
MISVKFNSKQFMKEMNNLTGYATGFLDGVKLGHPGFLKSFGESTLEALRNYIDSNARVNPQLLHHVYEWNQTGSPDARLFNLQCNVTGVGMTFSSTFRQSSVIKEGSRVPFFDKARIMEEGTPVTIIPKNRVLAFTDDNGEEVFTSKPVRVQNPGGNVAGEYEKVFDSFFNRYFTQAFMSASGITAYLSNPLDFDRYLSNGKRRGRAEGLKVGQAWIQKAGVL